MAEHLIVNTETGEASTRPLTAEEQAKRDAAAQREAEAEQVEANRTTNRTTLEQRAEQALTANADFLAITSPTNADAVKQVRLLTREASALIRLALRKLDTVEGT